MKNIASVWRAVATCRHPTLSPTKVRWALPTVACACAEWLHFAWRAARKELRTTPNNTAVAVTFLPPILLFHHPYFLHQGCRHKKLKVFHIKRSLQLLCLRVVAHRNEQHCSTQTTSVFLVSSSGNSSQRSQSLTSGQIRAVARLKRRRDSAQEEHRCSTSHIPTSAGTLSHLHCGKWVNFTPFNKFLVTLFMVLMAEKKYKRSFCASHPTG